MGLRFCDSAMGFLLIFGQNQHGDAVHPQPLCGAVPSSHQMNEEPSGVRCGRNKTEQWLQDKRSHSRHTAVPARFQQRTREHHQRGELLLCAMGCVVPRAAWCLVLHLTQCFQDPWHPTSILMEAASKAPSRAVRKEKCGGSRKEPSCALRVPL